MSDIRNCSRCGKIFNYIGKPICSRCIDEEEEQFKAVKDYIEENNGANMYEVSDATGVPVERIMKFLREERLEITSSNNNMVLECERCHRPIKSGRFCEKCKGDLETSFKKEFGISKNVYQPEKNKGDGDRMYTATRRKGQP